MPERIRVAHFTELTTRELHDILQLRADVFVVEQRCAYRDVDGRDLLADTLHVWIDEDGAVVSYLRMTAGDGEGVWIGRVATASSHRQRGLATALMRHALDAAAGSAVALFAQAHLEAWYQRFGFRRSGPTFIWDDIVHVPMRRQP